MNGSKAAIDTILENLRQNDISSETGLYKHYGLGNA